MNNNISNNVLYNFRHLKNVRDYVRSDFNIKSSIIPLDIIITVLDYQLNNNQELTMKRFLAESNHSATGIRYHLESLIEEELIYFTNSTLDKRLRILKAKPRLFEKIEIFNPIDFSWYNEK